MNPFTFLAKLFFGAVPLAVARSLRDEPERWRPAPYVNRYGMPYEMVHDSGLKVWTGNQSYGVAITPSGDCGEWGGVTHLSCLSLSPGHRLVYGAVKRWLRRNGRALSVGPAILANLATDRTVRVTKRPVLVSELEKLPAGEWLRT